jgi:exopolysaccharide biosynthesis polyprenyl glycosylphosphotransferase
MRRALVAADAVGVTMAFAVSSVAFPAADDRIQPAGEIVLFALTLPMWLLLAKLQGLYERDEERADHSTIDEFAGVLIIVTLGTWFFQALAWMTGLASPQFGRLVAFWVLAIGFVTTARAVARALTRRSAAYSMRTLVVGAGAIGQLVARKIGQHPEYRLDLVGFVDAEPLESRAETREVATLGELDSLQSLVAEHRIDRVIVAFSNEPDSQTMNVVRSLRDGDVIVDVVPRLFDVIGPRASMHSLEGMPLVCVPPARLSRSSFVTKRIVDIAVAASSLLVLLPLFIYAAIRIKLDSPGPVFFRQERLGLDMRPFTCLKFRTMKVDTDPEEHRAYVESIATSGANLNGNGMYKLNRDNAVTPFGRWLRKTSLDELPQLINVLRGDMSIVGPRPCIPYEIEFFQSHHVERFLVPQGITGLWQVSARANSTFGEALDMDVAYVRGWSLGLDLRLLFRTPFALLRQRRSTA